MRERTHNLVVRIDDDEQAKLHALADAEDQHASQLVRRWLAQHYLARFGEVPPVKGKRSKR